jgi:hypothetical protein
VDNAGSGDQTDNGGNDGEDRAIYKGAALGAPMVITSVCDKFPGGRVETYDENFSG